MNERERFVRTLTCDHPDRPSYGDYLAYDSTRERWEKEGLPKGLSRQQLFDHFSFDHIDIWGNDRLSFSESVRPAYSSELIEETNALASHRDAEVIPKVSAIMESGGGIVVECDHGVPPGYFPC